MESTGYNKRMGDNEGVPEMNGTIKRLVELIASPLETPQQQAQAIRDSIKLQLHTYMIIKQTLESVNTNQGKIQESLELLLKERKSIIDRLIDKGLVPFLYFVAMSMLWIVFNTFQP